MHYSMLTKHFCNIKIIMHTCSNPVKLTFINSLEILTKCFPYNVYGKNSILCDEELVMMHQINFSLFTAYYDEHYLELNLIFVMLL